MNQPVTWGAWRNRHTRSAMSSSSSVRLKFLVLGSTTYRSGMAPVRTTSTGRPRSPTRVVVEPLQAATAARISTEALRRPRCKVLAALAFRAGAGRRLTGRDGLSLVADASENDDLALAAQRLDPDRTRRFLEWDEFSQAGLPQRGMKSAGGFRR